MARTKAKPFEPYVKKSLDKEPIHYRLRIVQNLIEATIKRRGLKLLTEGFDKEYKDGYKATLLRFDRPDDVIIYITLVQTWIFQTSLDLSRGIHHRYAETIQCTAVHRGKAQVYEFFELEQCLVSLDAMSPT